MTANTRARLNGVTVRLRRGTTTQSKPMMLGRVGDHFTVAYDPERASLDTAAMLTRVRLRMEGYTVAEIILADHDPHLTSLYLACSKLRLDVEHTEGPLITEPIVKGRDEDWPYVVPKDWDAADALDRLPAAFAAARPDIARNLEWIEQAQRETGGKINQVLDMVASLILETGDPQGVYDQLVVLLGQAPVRRARPPSVRRADDRPDAHQASRAAPDYDVLFGEVMCQLDTAFRLGAAKARAEGRDPAAACRADTDLFIWWLNEFADHHGGVGGAS